MLVVLPFVALVLLILILHVTERSWHRAAIGGAVIWGLLITGLTEALSLLHALTAPWIAGGWAVTLVISGFVLWNRRNHGTPGRAVVAPSSPLLIGLVAGTGIIISTSGLIALLAPPNTWDSLTYHMSRVMHWIQNGTVAHYPTHIQRQLHHTPWAEFALLHLQLLTGNDRFANSLQWLSMVGSVIGVSLLAQQLGADTRGQTFSAVVAATIPMGVLQASSTQTDYVVAFWLVCCVHYILRVRKHGINGVRDPSVLGVAASLGLAVLTKPTAYVYALPFMIWFLTASLRTAGRNAWPAILTCLGLAFAINTGHYARNINLYGSPLGPMEADLPDGRYANEEISFPLFVSNLSRNVALQLQTPSETLNGSVEEGVHLLHRMIGVAIDDRRTTLFGGQRFHLPLPLFDEDGNGNFLHLVFIIVTLFMILCFRPLRETAGVVPYTLALSSAFVLFCLLVKWQPYNSRLHLPLFVLWSPLIGLSLAWIVHRRLINWIMVLTLLSSLPWLLLNNHRPLVGPRSIFTTDREALYFVVQPRSKALFKQIGQHLADLHCSNVGLIAVKNVPEYLLWVVLQGQPDIHIEHVSVTNQSAVLMAREPFRSFVACRTIVLEESPVDR